MTLKASNRNLERARFFLRHIEKKRQSRQLEVEEFAAYLSAFLSFARYITDFFERGKSKGDPKRKKWLKDFKDKLTNEDRAFLNFMIRQRDLEQHEEGAKAEPGVTFVSIYEADNQSSRFGESQGYACVIGTPVPRVGLLDLTWIRRNETHNVVQDCNRYLQILDKVLDDFTLWLATENSSASSQPPVREK